MLRDRRGGEGGMVGRMGLRVRLWRSLKQWAEPIFGRTVLEETVLFLWLRARTGPMRTLGKGEREGGLWGVNPGIKGRITRQECLCPSVLRGSPRICVWVGSSQRESEGRIYIDSNFR